jgi:cytochrome c oxidase subunit 2
MNDPATFQLPEQMSTLAPEVDWLYYFLYWLSVVMFVAIVTAMVYWAWKYRERPGHKAEPTGHNMTLEIAWTVAPLFVLVFIFHKGFQGYIDMSVAPADSMVVKVNAKQWAWEFVYPNGGSSEDLHVPVNKPVKPGAYSMLWFQATHVGHDDIMCAEYCGGRSKGSNGEELAYAPSDDPLHPYPAGQATGHWSMHSMLYVETQEDFDKFQRSIGDPCDQYVSTNQACPMQIAAEQGAKLYTTKGCVACHTLTGARLVGPSWKGIYGKDESTDHGTVLVDDAYIKESILMPQAKIVTGYQGVMPTFSGQVTDAELEELVSYIKSLKD